MNNKKQNFLIISPFDSNSHPKDAPTYAEISKITSESVIDYANSHGYYYLIADEDLSGRAISWDKVFLTRKYFNDPYDYIWCIDSDVMIMNHNIKLESIVDQNHDVFITCYQNNIEHLNTGSIIYRNTDWTKKFLEEIWNDEEFVSARPNCFFEQSAIIKYYKSHPKEQYRFKMIPVRDINSHFHAGFSDEKWNVNYFHGDLCLHAAGTDNNFRYETFKELKKWIIKYGEVPREGFNVQMWNK